MIPACQSLLLHADLDGVDGVYLAHRIMLILIGLDQRDQHVQSVSLGRAVLCTPKTLDLTEKPRPLDLVLRRAVVDRRRVLERASRPTSAIPVARQRISC